MSCYAITDTKTNIQLRVYFYDLLDPSDRLRAEKLAFDFANKNHKRGYPCIVEQFSMSDIVGTLVLDTAATPPSN